MSSMDAAITKPCTKHSPSSHRRGMPRIRPDAKAVKLSKPVVYANQSTLCLTLKAPPCECDRMFIEVPGFAPVTIAVVRVKGNKVRLSVTADKSINIRRPGVSRKPVESLQAVPA